MSVLRSYLEPNGNTFTKLYWYQCDSCYKEIHESDPHYEKENCYDGPGYVITRHFCAECAFLYGFVNESIFFRLKQLPQSIFNLHAAIHNGKVIVWSGNTPPWEMTLKELRGTPEYRAWRNSVLERDGKACKKCGSKEDLHAHHIKEFAKYPDLRFEVSNGLTLCDPCHKEEHRKG